MMDLLDANVLIAAFRPDHADHRQLRRCLESRLAHPDSITFPHLVEVAFLRIVSHPRIFRQPSTFGEANAFLQAIRESGAFAELSILPEFRRTLTELCLKLSLVGNDLNDAYLAAVAIDARLRLVSTDDGFRRFHGLNWVNPLCTKWP
jgi:toxin-antitoxin system PIN domain toxin